MPLDTQNFEVLGVVIRVQTNNLAGAAVNGVSVEVYKAGANASLASGNSTATGRITFNLDVGNYTFKALWKDVQLDEFNRSINVDTVLNFTLQLTNLRILVRDASDGLSFIDIRFSYNYTTRANVTKSEVVSLKTNTSGVVTIENVFSNMSYLLEAYHYGLTLPETPLKNETLPLPWNNIVILVPNYTALGTVFDAKGAAVSNVIIAAYEWSSGTTRPVQTQTSIDGNVSFTLTFGKYRLRALYDSLVLNETTLDLIEDNLSFTFYLTIYKTDIIVRVRDYFGQPIANANVTIERRVDERYVFVDSLSTDGDGSAKFFSNVGGSSRISVYVGGKLVAVKTQFLSGKSSLVEFQMPEYVAILGYPIPAGLFASLTFLIVIVVIVLVLTRGRLMKVFGKKTKK